MIFQRKGWRAEEILSGLAAVLPKNGFLYVESNRGKSGAIGSAHEALRL